MKTYVGIVRDHSGSMNIRANAAMKDYNLLIAGIRGSANIIHNIFVTVVECGVGYLGGVQVKEVNKPIAQVSDLTRYVADGSRTPLWESVWQTIDQLERAGSIVADRYIEESSAFLVEVITDGQNNVNSITGSALAARIRKLQATDRWTFVFRVPVGYKREILNIGVPDENIMEWEQTTAALVRSSEQNVQATQSYFTQRSLGRTSTSKFYTNLSDVSITEVKSELKDITHEIQTEAVWSADDGAAVREFCENHFGEYVIGCAYYQLMKIEKVQPQKKIIIKHKKSGKYYAGAAARTMLGLPDEEIRVHPGDHAQYDIYIQSTSVNRKLVANTKIVYWKGH